MRFRICQMINKLLLNLGDDAQIDEELYEQVYDSMLIRLHDKFPAVRTQAVTAVARLQDPSDADCPVIAGNSSNQRLTVVELFVKTKLNDYSLFSSNFVD